MFGQGTEDQYSGKQISCSSVSGPSAWVNQCLSLGCLIGSWRQFNRHIEKQAGSSGGKSILHAAPSQRYVRLLRGRLRPPLHGFIV